MTRLFLLALVIYGAIVLVRDFVRFVRELIAAWKHRDWRHK